MKKENLFTGASGKLLLVLFGLCISLALAELVVQVFIQEQKVVYEAAFRSLQPEDGFVETLISSTPLGPRLKPNRKVLIKKHYLSRKDIEIRTNALGIRGEPLEPLRQNKLKVLVLGDSIVFAEYENEKDTIPAILEDKIRAVLPGARVYNAGISGINIATEYNLYVELKDKIDPDIIILGSYLNDATGIVYSKPLQGMLHYSALARYIYRLWQHVAMASVINQEEHERRSFLLQWNNAIRYINQQQPYGRGQTPREQFAKLKRLFAFDWGSAWTEESWHHMKYYYARIKALADVDGDTVVYVLFPVKYQLIKGVADDYPQKQFEDIMLEMGMHHINMLPHIKQGIKNSPNFYYDHSHFTPKGNMFVADVLFEYLNSHNLLSISKRSVLPDRNQ